jgi:hypothetical protein
MLARSVSDRCVTLSLRRTTLTVQFPLACAVQEATILSYKGKVSRLTSDVGSLEKSVRSAQESLSKVINGDRAKASEEDAAHAIEVWRDAWILLMKQVSVKSLHQSALISNHRPTTRSYLSWPL